MESRKRIIRQHIKSALQKTLLPLCYKLSKKKDIDKKLVILADLNSVSTPESMELIKAELQSRGYKVREMYCDLSSCGMVSGLKYMMSFMKAYANARAVFICNYFVPVTSCKKREETTVVQLWHSCGALKKFGYDSEEDISSHFKGSVTRNFDLITVSSKECVKAFVSAFRLKEDIVKPLGVSRTDVFFDESYNEQCRREFFERYPDYKGKKIVLYAPTFRGNALDCHCVGEEYAAELEKKLGEAWKVIIKMHPRLHSGLTNCDIATNRLMPVADVLVTDYSSLVFEYALYKKPWVIFAPDIESYSKGRSFYLDYKTDMPAPLVTEGEKLAQAVLDSENTMGDLKWMRCNGLEAAVKGLSETIPVWGICGGYQMLGQWLEDPDGIEEGGSIRGMELLPVKTRLEQQKTRSQVTGTVNEIGGIFSGLSGLEYEGYEIHMGRTDFEKTVCAAEDREVYGTYVHGIFDRGRIAAALVEALARRKGIVMADGSLEDYRDFKERQYDKLADTLRAHLDMEAVYGMLREARLD